jgi:dUTP pyrophosphatase
MKRFFEKVSFDEFNKHLSSSLEIYEEYELPKRSTTHSAGYDIKVIKDVIINPGEIVKIPTGIKASMFPDEVMFIIIRSSMGYKNLLSLPNQVGVIDSDYYNNNDNEGHIFIPIQNNGKVAYTIKKGDSYAQGIFTKFLLVENEQQITKSRIGGFGSTSEEN